LQQALFGSSFMPDDELMIWTPDHVRDNPDSYNTWYKAQVEKEKKGIKNPYKR